LSSGAGEANIPTKDRCRDGDNRRYRLSLDKINATLPGFQYLRDVKLGAISATSALRALT
jgi:hypothetical protein